MTLFRLYVFRCLEESPRDIFIDAVFSKDEDETLGGGDSDSDGYLAEVFFNLAILLKFLCDGSKYSHYFLVFRTLA